MIIVTGGAGFVGSNLVDKLIKNHEVLVIDNFVTGKRENINPKAILWRNGGDLLDFFQFPQDMPSKVEVIFHLAALARIQPSFRNPVATYSANSTGTMVALEMARKYNAKVVYAGSSTAYSDVMSNPYAYFKKVGEEHCRLYNKIYGVSAAIARFFNVYGPRQVEDGDYATVIGIWEKQYRNQESLTITGDGEQRRDFTHVDDIVNGLIAASIGRWNADIFNLGSGKNYSLNEVVQFFKDARIKYLPKRAGEAQTTLADIHLSEELLGWHPQHDLKGYLNVICKQ